MLNSFFDERSCRQASPPDSSSFRRASLYIQAARLPGRLSEEPSLVVALLPFNPRFRDSWRAPLQIKYLLTLVTFPYYIGRVAMVARRYDMLHIFLGSYLSFVLAPTPAPLAARSWWRRCILNYRSDEAEDHFRRWRRTALPTVWLANAVIASAGYLPSVFERLAARARAILNFVDLGTFTLRERRTVSPTLLSIRNLEPLCDVARIVEEPSR